MWRMVFVLIFLAGCAGGNKSGDETPVVSDQLAVLTDGSDFRIADYEVVETDGCVPKGTPNEMGVEENTTFGLIAMFPRCDTTYLHYDPGHGFQVAYHRGDVEILWYPGNQRPTLGLTKFDESADQLCFLYGDGSFNPVTQQYGGDWECSSLRIKRVPLEVVSALDGDPFGLTSLKLPHVLERCAPPREFELMLPPLLMFGCEDRLRELGW